MKITRKREIILERTRRVTIKFDNAPNETFCRECGGFAHFVPVDEAAAVCEMSSRQIFRLVENALIHFQENKQGRLLICLASLAGLGSEIIALPENTNRNE